jgi:hypothetical protein
MSQNTYRIDERKYCNEIPRGIFYVRNNAMTKSLVAGALHFLSLGVRVFKNKTTDRVFIEFPHMDHTETYRIPKCTTPAPELRTYIAVQDSPHEIFNVFKDVAKQYNLPRFHPAFDMDELSIPLEQKYDLYLRSILLHTDIEVEDSYGYVFFWHEIDMDRFSDEYAITEVDKGANIEYVFHRKSKSKRAIVNNGPSTRTRSKTARK